MNFNQTSGKYMLSLLISVSLLMGLISCDKTEPVTPTVDDVFSILGSELISEVFPEPSGNESNQPVITNITGNGSVLAGGTNLLTVIFTDPQDDAKYILVSMEGEDGYYRTEITTGNNASMTMLLDQDIIQNALNIFFTVEDKKGHVSEMYAVPVKRVDAGTGNLQVSLSWDIDNDMDLHLVQPDGEEIYYLNEYSSTGGSLDTDSNPFCFIDGLRNENITYGDGAVVLAGDYIVRANFYKECQVAGAKTNISVVTYLEGNIVATLDGSNPYSGSFASGTAAAGGLGDGREIMRFNVPQQIGKKGTVVIDYGFTARKRKAANNPNPKQK